MNAAVEGGRLERADCNERFIRTSDAIGENLAHSASQLHTLALLDGIGFLSENVHPATGELRGNFPRTYSMAGTINIAARLSWSWQEARACD